MWRAISCVLLCAIALAASASRVAAEPPDGSTDGPATRKGDSLAEDMRVVRRNQSMNNLKQIGLAILNDESARKRLTQRAVFDKDDKPLLSWRVRMLPYLEEVSLYKQFHLDEPWDSEHNKELLENIPGVFRDPRIETDAGMTVYQAVVGPGMAFEGDKLLALQDIKDGTSKTICVVEVAADKAVPWTKPEDWEIDANDPLKGVADVQPGGDFLALFLDGHVDAIQHAVEPKLLKAMCTRDAHDKYDSNSVPSVK